MSSLSEPAAAQCSQCGATNLPAKNFCGDCGSRLAPIGGITSTEAQVLAILNARLKDQKLVELETAQAVLARITDWAKIFGWFVAIPLGLLAVTLGVWGISSFVDFRRLVESNRQQIVQQIADAKATTERIKSEADALHDQFANVSAELGTLPSDVKQLTSKVQRIEERVGFVKTSALTPQLQAQLTSFLEEFRNYCRQVGFTLKAGSPKVRIVDNPPYGAASYYDPATEEMVIATQYAQDPIFLFREYMHRVLFPTGDLANIGQGNIAVESGLACYYPASYRNTPQCGFFDLSKPSPFANPHRADGDYPTAYGIRVWGGLFWELRQTLGQRMCDRLLLSFWRAIDAQHIEQDYERYAVSELLKAYTSLGGDPGKIRSLFTKRGLSI
jgi:hypothetical protein